jgi:hypothetical protein
MERVDSLFLRLNLLFDPDLRQARRKSGVTLVRYAVTILVGLLLPIVVIVFYFALAVFLVVPFKTVSRELSVAAASNSSWNR